MMRNNTLSSCAALVLLFSLTFLTAFCKAYADTDPKFYAVQASANVQLSPPQVQLIWAADPKATGYTVYRKAPDASNWGPGTSISGSATTFVDNTVAAGAAYEYQVSKSTSAGYSGYGYVCAGLNAPVLEDRGKIILLVDSLFSVDLASELTRLQQDLVGDGWTVLRHDVSRTDSPANIKSIIQADYASDPGHVKALFLFGHVPVPYSGNLNPDGHPDHQGAWPTDAYYGDVDGSWTDNSVSNTSSQHSANWNVPGDGKFDQSELPSDVELEVGRVDLANMTCFSNKNPARYEKDLLRQYLNKDHKFRSGLMAVQRRGLVCDNFGEKSGEAFAASGWRNFAAFFGAENVSSVPGWNYFSTVGSQSYLWSYGCGGGSYYTCDGIGSSDDFATTDTQTVFTMFLGSYFGDWDNESNFLRAPLGSTSATLAVAWAGRPHWYFQHMGVGETIGYSARLSQNNHSGGLYSPQNYGTHGVHLSLLGDPTLRLHPVLPPAGLGGVAGAGGLVLNWSASADSNIQGYYVYRSPDARGPFVRISGSAPLSETTFTDPAGAPTLTYMVRAIKLERSGSGTYFNPSQGVFFGPDSTTSWGSSGTSPAPTVPLAPTGLVTSIASATQVTLSWTDVSRNETGFNIQRKTGGETTYVQVGTVGPSVTTFTDSGLDSGVTYVYTVTGFNGAGTSPVSGQAAVSTPRISSVPASALFIAADRTTQGNWTDAYGFDGYNVLGDTPIYPSYALVAPAGKADWTWAWSTSDPRGLQVASTPDRVAACWYSASTFTIDLNLVDGQPHEVTIYCADWDTAARRQTVDVLDASTGAILNSQAIADFNGGVYLSWNLTGHVVLRLTRNGGFNAVVQGLFFDIAASASDNVAAPTITPDGGTFADPTLVNLACGSAGATIRYTLDGTEPTSASPAYTQPFTLSVSTTVRAKAFSGLAESPAVSAVFSLNRISSGQAQALFVRTDSGTQGNWKGVYGTEGYKVVGDPSGPANLPGYVQIADGPTPSYVWTDLTADPRALQQGRTDGRVAGCWYGDPGLTLDVDFNDGRTHRLALYCLDWDGTSRSETVDLLDAATGALLASQRVANFNGGTYLVWDIKGHVLVRFTKTTGNNALVMGLFFGPAATQLANAGAGFLSATSPSNLSTSGFQFQIQGQVGERFVIQASSDLQHWDRIGEVTLPSRILNYVDLQAGATPLRFYRALPATGEAN